jgi:3-phenylpropionate/cinnamic acid dioxygenase small subunit
MTDVHAPALVRVPRTDERYAACADFLDDEAAALDENRLDDWLAMLHPDIDYRVPIRLSRERAAGLALSEGGYHLFEDHASLRTRVERLATDYAWAEDPPSRTRRFVSNVRVFAVEGEDDLVVRSALMLYRECLDHSRPEMLCGARDDRLRPAEDGLRLVRRVVVLDHTVLGTHNLSVLL